MAGDHSVVALLPHSSQRPCVTSRSYHLAPPAPSTVRADRADQHLLPAPRALWGRGRTLGLLPAGAVGHLRGGLVAELGQFDLDGLRQLRLERSLLGDRPLLGVHETSVNHDTGTQQGRQRGVLPGQGCYVGRERQIVRRGSAGHVREQPLAQIAILCLEKPPDVHDAYLLPDPPDVCCRVPQGQRRDVTQSVHNAHYGPGNGQERQHEQPHRLAQGVSPHPITDSTRWTCCTGHTMTPSSVSWGIFQVWSRSYVVSNGFSQSVTNVIPRTAGGVTYWWTTDPGR